MQHLDEPRIIVVHDLAVPQIKLCDLCHIFITKGKIPDIHILHHAVFVHGFRNYDHASLHIPPKGCLSRALPIFFPDLCQYRMSEDSIISFSKWSPRFWNHSVFSHESQGVFLLGGSDTDPGNPGPDCQERSGSLSLLLHMWRPVPTAWW